MRGSALGARLAREHGHVICSLNSNYDDRVAFSFHTLTLDCTRQTFSIITKNTVQYILNNRICRNSNYNFTRGMPTSRCKVHVSVIVSRRCRPATLAARRKK